MQQAAIPLHRAIGAFAWMSIWMQRTGGRSCVNTNPSHSMAMRLVEQEVPNLIKTYHLVPCICILFLVRASLVHQGTREGTLSETMQEAADLYNNNKQLRWSVL
ncbi:hypothetical protein B0T09DRAFT_117278 [Sordaria sp. MPI-SDFR-AT-0083]|nr:hypothetical protein B0T09DRAFT_117278 [Sordaria sp. MPI-SDFR-AT-0083]